MKRINTLFMGSFLLVSLLIISGCGSAPKLPEEVDNAAELIKNLDSKVFEVSRNELILKPYPDINNRDAFNFVYPVIIDAPTKWLPSHDEPKFMEDLNRLLQRDLGISVDYQKILKNRKFKVTKKPGFRWDPELFWPMAVEKVKTGNQHIEIFTRAVDTLPGMDPAGIRFETYIRVKLGSKLLKQYHIRADVLTDLTPTQFRIKLMEFFIFIPELMSVRANGIYLSDASIADEINRLRALMRKKQQTDTLPEKELLELQNMVFDGDPFEEMDELYLGEEDAQALTPADADIDTTALTGGEGEKLQSESAGQTDEGHKKVDQDAEEGGATLLD